MNKLLTIIGAVALLICGVSCESLKTGASLPIPFSDPPSRVGVDVQLDPVPPKFSIGLNFTDNNP